MAKGWVVIYRSIMDNPLWEDKPFSRGQAWIDMILLASHKDTEFYFDGDMLPVEKGQIITSKRKLGDRWGWSNSKVNKFLNELEKVGMLVQKSDTKKTTIKIVKYEQYQGFGSIDAVEKTSHKTSQKRHRSITQASQRHHSDITETSQRHTFNNVNNYNNDNNDNNVNKKEPAAPSSSDVDEEGIDLWNMSEEEYAEMQRRVENGDIRI